MEDNLNDVATNGTDTTQTDPSSAQTDQNGTTLDNAQETNTEDQGTGSETTSEGKTEVGAEGSEDKEVPAHLVPRFKEVVEEKNLYKKQIELLQQQIEQNNAKSSSDQKQETKPIEDLPDEQFAPFFEQLPERTFKENKFDDQGNLQEGYSSYGELYKDFLRYAVKDLALINTQVGEKQQQQQQEETKQVEQQNAQVKQILAQDTTSLKLFTEWLSPILKTPTEQNEWIANMTFTQQAQYFKQHVLNEAKQKATSANKDAARKASGTNPANGVEAAKGVDIQKLRKQSIQDFYNG